MPTFYNYTENGVVYSFDDVFVPADAFRKGTLWTWGRNSYGQLGTNDTNNRTTPVTTFSGGANWKQVSCGTFHTTAVKTDGTLWTWGYNANGQLGDNTVISKSIPTQVSVGSINWKQVVSGGLHTAAIKTDGTLWTWGYNANGQLGDNTVISKSIPTQVSVGNANWKQVSCGSTHTAAIKTDGTLWTWGYNIYGQLGDNTTIQRNIPVQTSVGGTDWKQVTAGGNHTAAIKNNGTLWTWGLNNLGQLGNGTNGLNLFANPVEIGTATTWKQVACGDVHTTAIKTDGTLWAWGSNGSYQLGIGGQNAQFPNPTEVFGGGTNWKQVTAGEFHSAAVKTDGTLWAWGFNTDGQIGNGTTSQIATPVGVFGGETNWKQVSCGFGHTAATKYIDDYL